VGEIQALAVIVGILVVVVSVVLGAWLDVRPDRRTDLWRKRPGGSA